MTRPNCAHESRLSFWLLAGALATGVLGGKFWLIHRMGFALPWWDQWDSEWELTLRPWIEGRLSLRDLFLPHSEHRIVTTKASVIGLLTLNGQWDALVEMVFNACVHTAAALTLFRLGAEWMRGVWLTLYAVFIGALMTTPVTWENSLSGFQLQFYYLLLFSLGQVAGLLAGRQFSALWGGGVLCGLLALISMASGFLASAAVLAVLLYRLVRTKHWTVQEAVTALLCAGLCGLGWALKTEAPGHAYLKVESGEKLLRNVAALLSWPWAGFAPFGMLLTAPAVWFTARLVRRRSLDGKEATLLALLIWVALQVVAISYSRGAGGASLAGRYIDLVLIGLICGWICLAASLRGRVRMVVAAVWLPLVLGGVVYDSVVRWREVVVPVANSRTQQEINVRNYQRTGDPTHLRDKPFGEIPYPHAETLIARMSHPALPNLLPANVRKTVAVGATRGFLARLPDALSDTDAPPLAVSTWADAASSIAWQSRAQPNSTLPVLQFKVAGEPGTGGSLSVFVKSEAGAVAVPLADMPSQRWKTVHVVRPTGSWWIEVQDRSTDGWIALTEPVELSRGSYFTRKLLKHFAAFLTTAGALFVLGIGAQIWRSRARGRLEGDGPLAHTPGDARVGAQTGLP